MSHGFEKAAPHLHKHPCTHRQKTLQNLLLKAAESETFGKPLMSVKALRASPCIAAPSSEQGWVPAGTLDGADPSLWSLLGGYGQGQGVNSHPLPGRNTWATPKIFSPLYQQWCTILAQHNGDYLLLVQQSFLTQSCCYDTKEVPTLACRCFTYTWMHRRVLVHSCPCTAAVSSYFTAGTTLSETLS